MLYVMCASPLCVTLPRVWLHPTSGGKGVSGDQGYLSANISGGGGLQKESCGEQDKSTNTVTATQQWVLLKKTNCAISSGFAVTYCTNVGLGLAGPTRLFSHYLVVSI